jgi:hypothetical protein
MGKYVVTFVDEIDEIEINGFTIMTDKGVDSFEELAESITWPFTYPIGDSELEFTSGDDLLTRLDFKEITNEEYKAFKTVFNGSFGTFISESFLETLIEEEGDEDESDEDDYDNDTENDDNY